MTNTSDIDTVSDLFPAYPRSELAARLLCAKSIEDVIEELFAEQLKPPANYDVGVYQLKDMFPSEALDSLAALLQRNNGNMEHCIDHLMKPDLGVRLAELTGLPIRMMSEKIKSVEARSNIKVGKKHSQCQDTTLLQALVEVVFDDTRLGWNSRKVTRQEVTQEEEELNAQVMAEKLLKRLNYAFLERCLRFFKYDLVKVLDAARLFTEAEMELLTFLHDFESRPNYKSLSSFNSNSSHSRNEPWAVQSRAKAHGSMKENIRPADYIPNQINYSTHLDLHGYTVGEAVALANKTANAWWLEEQRLNVEQGLMHKVGAKATHLDYLVIVTGRGLHSVGGPKIKGSVLRLLTQKGYLIQEDVGSIIVMGRKKA